MIVATARPQPADSELDALLRAAGEDILRLRALDRDAVKAIAAAQGAGDPPPDDIIARSGGLPRAVLTAVAEWEEAEAARRLQLVAGDAAAGRGDLRELEAEVVERVEDLRAASERARRRQHEGAVGVRAPSLVCPFRAWRPSTSGTPPVFFGREQLIAEMVADSPAPLFWLCRSVGSGKSSTCAPDCCRALPKESFPGATPGTSRCFVPGASRCASGSRPGRPRAQAPAAVLAVDQFEETFTPCDDDDGAQRFMDAILSLRRDPERRRWCARGTRRLLRPVRRMPGSRRCTRDNHVLVGPMDATRSVARSNCRPHAPACAGAALVDALVAEVEGEPGALPLLSTALLELWHAATGAGSGWRAYGRRAGCRARSRDSRKTPLAARSRPRAGARHPAAAGRRGRRARPRPAGRVRRLSAIRSLRAPSQDARRGKACLGQTTAG